MIRKLKLSTCALLPAIFVGGLIAQPVDWNEIPLADGIWSENSSAFHEATFEIPVPAQSWLEFKLAMEEGDTVVYEWHAAGGEVGLLSTEFHGHTEPVDGKGDLMFYKVHQDRAESGALTAPFSGIHGWYLNNESDTDVTVTLKVAGFFTEIPDQL